MGKPLRGQLEGCYSEPGPPSAVNHALLFRDPAGNLVDLFTPVTEVARAKFAAERAAQIGNAVHAHR